jgi:membrane dipeptidase
MTSVDIHAHPLLDRLYCAKDPRQRSPGLPRLSGDRLSFDALTSGQVDVVVSSTYPFWWLTRKSAYMDRCRDILNLIEAHLAEHPDRATVATDFDGIERARAQGEIAFIHAVEGGHVLEGRLENLERLYDWGVRSLTLTHFVNNDLAASTLDPRHKFAGQRGLTPFGREVVARMNALGMIIDLAHSSERAFWQTLELTQQPVIVSHTGVRHFVPWEICLSDEQLRALARNGGMVGIILSSFWLKRFQRVIDVRDVVDNILYVRNLVGVEHVGIGSDFNGAPPLRGARTAADFPRIEARLLEAGLPDQEVAKIMGGNFLRLFRQVVSS